MNPSAIALRVLGTNVALTACTWSGDSSSATIERADTAGIEILTIVGPPPDTTRVTSVTVRIGSTEVEGVEDQIFEHISDVVLLSNNRTVVVDNRGARVAVFDSMGTWLFDAGRRGEGPGEYTAPIRASVYGDTLFIWDARQRRFLWYDGDGGFLGGRTMTHRRAHPFAIIEGGYVLEAESGQLADPAPALGVLTVTPRDGGVIDTVVGPYPVPETGWTITDQATGMGHMVNPPALAVRPRWRVARGRLFWLNPVAGTVDIRRLETGDVEGVVRLPYDVAPPRASAQDAYFQAMQAEFGFADAVVSDLRRSTIFADVHPPVAAIEVDDHGRIWVARHSPAAFGRGYVGSGWDVVDARLGRVVHVRFPAGFELKAVGDRRAYGVTTLDNGVHVVDVFRLDDW